METFNCQPLLDRLKLVMVRTGALREFCRRETPLDKIRYCLEAQVLFEADFRVNIKEELESLLGVLYERCADHGKCETAAVQAKAKGSKAYLKKHGEEALSSYTECLRLAPSNSPTLPLAYANRAAVLVQMTKFESALQDLERAEVAGYPASLRHKLVARRARCQAELGQVSQAKETLQELREFVVASESKEKLEKEILEIEGLLEKPKSPPPTSQPEEQLKVPELVDGERHSVKYMTSAFEMRYSEKFGRHIVANKNISGGSVVMTEEPYAVLLLPDLLTSHCLTCLAPAPLPLPCVGCRDVVYCCDECRNKGQQGSHRYECRLLHLLSSVGIAHLALRTVLKAGWDLYTKIRDEDSEDGHMAGTGKDGGYNGAGSDGAEEGRYRAVYHLMPHLASCSPEDQLQYCLASIILATTISDKTDFLRSGGGGDGGGGSGGGGGGWCVDTLAAALMRHIAQLVSNAHAITCVERSSDGGVCEGGLEEVHQRRVASAIYPTASLMNHSCKPNIINSFVGDTLIIRTIEDVKEGDQIFNCYGPHYCRQPRAKRQEALKQQYFFTCKCPPCTQPQYMRKEAVWNGVQCEACGGIAFWVGGDQEDGCGDDPEKNGYTEKREDEKRGVLFCIHCHKLQSPSSFLTQTCSRATSLLEGAESALKQGEVKQAMDLAKAGMEAGAGTFQRASTTMIRLKDTLAAAMAANGDYVASCEEVRERVGLTESRYGLQSVELAHELLKFSDVLALARNSCQNAAKYDEELEGVKKRINEIFTLNYGPQWKLYLGTQGN